MTPRDAKDVLEDIVARGIAIDVFQAEEALALDRLIGQQADRINAATFGAYFGSLQVILGRYMILAVNRIYERPNNRYQLRSIPAAITFLRENARKLAIVERPGMLKAAMRAGFPAQDYSRASDEELTVAIADYFWRGLPHSGLAGAGEPSEALLALKAARDKQIAHHELIDSDKLPKATYGDIQDLISYAKQFLGAIGFGYLSIVYESDDGEYFLSSAAERATRCLRRILKAAGVPEEASHV